MSLKSCDTDVTHVDLLVGLMFVCLPFLLLDAVNLPVNFRVKGLQTHGFMCCAQGAGLSRLSDMKLGGRSWG